MVDVSTEITIRCPVERVSSYAADPENAARWYANIRSVEWETRGGLRAGARIRFEARFLGRTLAYTYEVVEHVPGQRLVMRTADGPFPMETVYTWTPDGDDGTRMRLRNSGRPAGFPKLVAPFLAAAMRRANRNDLRKLQSILEREPSR